MRQGACEDNPWGEGTPEKVAEEQNSFTGKFIKELLGTSRMKKTA